MPLDATEDRLVPSERKKSRMFVSRVYLEFVSGLCPILLFDIYLLVYHNNSYYVKCARRIAGRRSLNFFIS